jgi:hypothetical protein
MTGYGQGVCLGYDPRESRLGYDPRESRLGYDPRESRLGYDPRESRLGREDSLSLRLGQILSNAMALGETYDVPMPTDTGMQYGPFLPGQDPYVPQVPEGYLPAAGAPNISPTGQLIYPAPVKAPSAGLLGIPWLWWGVGGAVLVGSVVLFGLWRRRR